MDKALTEKEFYKQACRWADSINIQTAAKWWAAFNEVIVREIFFNASVKMPKIGTFGTRIVGEQIQKQKDPKTGKDVIYQVPERIVPVFYPDDDFINDCNNQGVTKAYRKRLKKGQLTQRDYERQIRAESMAVVGALSEEKIEKAKAEFEKMLKAKKKEFDEKVEPEIEED